MRSRLQGSSRRSCSRRLATDVTRFRTYAANLIALLGLLVGVADAGWMLVDHLHLERVQSHVFAHDRRLLVGGIPADPLTDTTKEITQ